MRKPDEVAARKGSRTIEYKWRTPSRDVDTSYSNPELGWEAYAVLSIYHDKDRKQFSAHLSTIKEKEGVMKFGLFTGVVVTRRPVARYSEKAQWDFAQHALEVLVAALPASEKVAEIMAEAGEE